MAAHSRHDGEAADSLLTILSLNCNKRADLGGLLSFIRECQPHLIFLQEVYSLRFLSTLASAYGYQVSSSTLHLPSRPRTCAVLSRLPGTVVQDLQPGHSQHVTVGALAFLNIHAPSSTYGERNTFFRSLRPHLSSPIPPILIGDFNCVMEPRDREGAQPLPLHSTSPPLAAILAEVLYTDAFRTLHPAATAFSFHRRGATSSRLDRAYLLSLIHI